MVRPLTRRFDALDSVRERAATVLAGRGGTGAADVSYVAVIFTSLRTEVDDEGYSAAAARMEELARDQPGFLGLESARGADRVGITVSYWRTEDDARAWKQHSEHLAVQATGRERWYEWYRLRVAVVEREYSHPTAGR